MLSCQITKLNPTKLQCKVICEELVLIFSFSVKYFVYPSQFLRSLALRSRVLVIGSREKEEQEEEKEEEKEKEEKNLQIAFRCIEAVPILSLDY